MRRIRLPAWGLALLLTASWLAMVVQPVSSTFSRVATLALALCAWAAWRMVPRLRQPATWAGMTGLALLLAVLLAPARASPDCSALREAFIARLHASLGISFVWGGENARGVDCSGMIRRAWRQSLAREGIRQANPAWLREALLNWWFDASARAMGEGYRDRTTAGFSLPMLAGAPDARLQPGDLAVTAQGHHILAHVGGGRWIQADPGAGAVILVDAATSDNEWLRLPMNIVRWHELGESATSQGREQGKR